MCRCAVFAVGILVATVSAGAEPEKAPQDNVEQILNGVLKERQRLTSGVFDVTGTSNMRRHGPEVNSDVLSHCAFDRAKQCLRYDNEESQIRIVVTNAPGATITKEFLQQAEGSVRRLKLRFVKNAEYSASWKASGDQTQRKIILQRPDARSRSFEGDHHMFDVRSVGLMGYLEWERCRPVEEIVEWLRQLHVDEAIQTGHDLTLRLSDKTSAVDLRIETNDGLRPVSFRVRSINPNETRVDSTMSVKWGRVGDIDVPVEIEYVDDIPANEQHTEYRLKLDWKSVNKSVDTKEFDYLSFRGLPKGGHVSVWDHRDQRPILLGDWIDDGVVEKPLE